MISYKQFSYLGKITSIFKLVNGIEVMSIPFDPANTDYQAYLKWLEEGNTPLPAEGTE
jgi:hypothetical protein